MVELVVFVFEQLAKRRQELQEAFQSQGYRVHAAAESADLVSEIQALRPHLVVLDLDLPQDRGLALLKSIHDMMPSLPVVAETTRPTVEGAVEAMRRGAYNYVSKHSPPQVIVDTAAHALEKERLRVEALVKTQERRVRSIDYPEMVAEIEYILANKGHSEAALISCLQDIQKELNYLPQDALKLVAARVGVGLPRVYAIATFYKSFSLRPRGRHLIHVCLGTACHVRGGAKLLESFERELGLQTGGTTYDNRFTLESVRCVGCCGLAPVVMVDGKFYGKVTQEKVPEIIQRYD